MKNIEFEVTLKEDGTIIIPEAFRDQVAGKKVKVSLSYEDNTPSAKPPEHYTKGYDQKDSLYDAY